MSREEQFSLPFEEPQQEPLLTRETILSWTPERQTAEYKKLFVQSPTSDMGPEQIAEGILHPEEERTRIIIKNRREDHQDAISHYPGGRTRPTEE